MLLICNIKKMSFQQVYQIFLVNLPHLLFVCGGGVVLELKFPGSVRPTVLLT